MRRSRADILADIEYYTQRLNKHPEWLANYTKFKKDYTKWIEEARKELKAFDEANNEN